MSNEVLLSRASTFVQPTFTHPTPALDGCTLACTRKTFHWIGKLIHFLSPFSSALSLVATLLSSKKSSLKYPSALAFAHVITTSASTLCPSLFDFSISPLRRHNSLFSSTTNTKFLFHLGKNFWCEAGGVCAPPQIFPHVVGWESENACGRVDG